MKGKDKSYSDNIHHIYHKLLNSSISLHPECHYCCNGTLKLLCSCWGRRGLLCGCWGVPVVLVCVMLLHPSTVVWEPLVPQQSCGYI